MLPIPKNILKRAKTEKIRIKYIEISPLINGYQYKANFIYDIDEEEIDERTKKEETKEQYISIDLGVKNLMTIYNPNGKQEIIKGGKVISINEYYNKKIGYHQSKLEKEMKVKTSKRIKQLFLERRKKINEQFNKIVSYFKKNHNDKTIIIGYNEGWKQNVKLHTTDATRKFVQIPYNLLLMKLRDYYGAKMKEIGEYYTSKCDALNLEPIGKKNKYDGVRVKRGMFQSKTGQLINADLNGAINIMRLYLKKEFKAVDGNRLMNPEVIKYSNDV